VDSGLSLTQTGVSGGVTYFSNATTLASSATLTANVPVLGAIALQGMADVHSANGRKAEAGKMLQAALAPAAAASSPPVPILFNLYHNLGALRYEEQKWDEAEVYFNGAAEFALLQHDPQQRLHCWEMMGRAQYQQNKIEPALKTRNGVGNLACGVLARSRPKSQSHRFDSVPRWRPGSGP